MVTVRVAHTADLDERLRAQVRELLRGAFDDLAESDWEHALGGLHALAVEHGTVVGHAALVQRRLLHRGRALRAGYVEGVAVRPDRRGRGHGAAVMAAVEGAAARAYDLAALSTTEQARGFYLARGWVVWRGPSCALTPAGLLATPDEDGGILVLPLGTPLDPDAPLTCDWRDGDLW